METENESGLRDPETGEPVLQYLTFQLSKVHAKLNAQATQMLHEVSGITLMQWRLIALIGTLGRTRLTEIAHVASLDKGLLSRNLKVLIEKGIVIGREDDEDHRALNLELSPGGQEIFANTMPVTRARQRRLRRDLTAEELGVFRRVLDKLEGAAEDREFWR